LTETGECGFCAQKNTEQGTIMKGDIDMGFGIFDFSDGDMAWSISDDMAIDSEGNTMMRIGNNQAVDLSTGEMHFVSGWEQKNRWDDEDDDW